MAWDRSKEGRRKGLLMRAGKPRSPLPWACSSFSSSEKFLPSFDNMMESWVERDSEKFESSVCAGCQGQVAPQDSPLLRRSQKADGTFVLPQSILTRWSVLGKKVYCRTSIQSSIRWQRTDSSQRICMSMMFLDFYEQQSGNIFPDGNQTFTGNNLRDVRVQTGALRSGSFLEEKPDLSAVKDHYRRLVFSLAGAAGMRLICPPLKLPILEIIMFAHQQLSPKNRASVLEEGKLWRFPLNLAIATLRPFCGSVVRRCLTVFLCMTQMRTKRTTPNLYSRSPPPDLYSVVQLETERLDHNQFTASCKQVRRDDLVATQDYDNSERNMWNDSEVFTGVGKKYADIYRKCLPINGQSPSICRHSELNNAPQSPHCAGFPTSKLGSEMEGKSRGTTESLENILPSRAESGGESLKRLRPTEEGPTLPKRLCIQPFSVLNGNIRPLHYVQCKSGTLRRATDCEAMVQATHPGSVLKKTSNLTHDKVSNCQEEMGRDFVRESKVVSNHTCVSNNRSYSNGRLPECRFDVRDCDYTECDDEYYYASMDNIPKMTSEKSAEANLLKNIGLNNRNCSSQLYSTGDSIPERLEVGKTEMDKYPPLPKFLSNRSPSLENVEFNRTSLDSTLERSDDALRTCFMERRAEAERKNLAIGGFKDVSGIVGNDVFQVESSPAKFELDSGLFCNGKVDNNQGDRCRSGHHRISSQLEDKLHRDSSNIQESDDPFADHPICIQQRMRRHSHGDQTYLKIRELPSPWGQLIFWHGRCKEGRPTLCVLLGKAVRQLPSHELKHFIAVTVSHVEYAEVNFFKGPVKRMNILMDLEGLGFMRLPPLNILSSIGAVLNRDYPGRGGWIMLINAPVMLGLVVGTIQGIILRPSHNKGVPMDSSFKGFLEGNERVYKIGSKYRPVLQKHFEASMLPSALGGECTCNLEAVDCKRGLDFLSITET